MFYKLLYFYHMNAETSKNKIILLNKLLNSSVYKH